MELRDLVSAAILAPSTHNTQPWRFVTRADGGLEVWADATRALARIDPHGRQLHMSCAAALFHLRIGLRALGRADEVAYLPDPAHPQLLAIVRAGAHVHAGVRETELWDAIPHRRTVRDPYDLRPVSGPIGDDLEREAAFEGAWLVRLHPHDKLEVGHVVAEGDRRQLSDPAYREELARWLVPRGSARRDGIPMTKKDVATAVPGVATAIVKHVDRSVGIAAREQALITDSPMVAVLGTDFDEPRDWIAAGEAMEAVLLRATVLGLGASFLNQAIEEASLRPRIARAAQHGGYPQLVLRFGYGPQVEPAPRRPIEDVLSSSART